jgi:hypothetical protein
VATATKIANWLFIDVLSCSSISSIISSTTELCCILHKINCSHIFVYSKLLLHILVSCITIIASCIPPSGKLKCTIKVSWILGSTIVVYLVEF